jgi:hypothetical protein
VNREREHSLGLIFEQYGPLAFGVLTAIGNTVVFRFALLDHPDWGNRLLDRVIQAASVGVAFWGIAITLFIGMESKPIVGNLKKLGYFGLIVRYFSEALIATFLFLTLSVLLEPLSKRFLPIVLSSLWLAFGVWALATTIRTYVLLTKILTRME